jgi:putative Mn2+ efflux pump MntP
MPSKTPRATPATVPAAVVVALLLIGLAVVAVRDLVVAQGWSTGTPWLLSLARSLDGLTASIGVVVAGVVLVLVGLLVLWLGLKPARRTHLEGRTDADLWLTPAALAALARAAADRSAGVISAEAGSVGRRKITIDVLTRGEAATVTREVEAALDDTVRGLAATTIAVRTKEIPR